MLRCSKRRCTGLPCKKKHVVAWSISAIYRMYLGSVLIWVAEQQRHQCRRRCAASIPAAGAPNPDWSKERALPASAAHVLCSLGRQGPSKTKAFVLRVVPKFQSLNKKLPQNRKNNAKKRKPPTKNESSSKKDRAGAEGPRRLRGAVLITRWARRSSYSPRMCMAMGS